MTSNPGKNKVIRQRPIFQQGIRAENGMVVTEDADNRALVVDPVNGHTNIPNSYFLRFNGTRSIRRSGGQLIHYTGGGNVSVYDDTNNVYVGHFKEGGNFEVPNGIMQNSRPQHVRNAPYTANTTITSVNEIHPADTSGGTVTLTLDATAFSDGDWVTVKDEGGSAGTNAITVATSGSQTIDGATSITVSSNYGSVDVYHDGTNFFTR